MWDGDLLSQTLLQVEAVLIIQRWNWQSENTQIRIIKLSCLYSRVSSCSWQVRRRGLAHHITADEILKSGPRWTHWFVSADWSRRRKQEDGRVFGELKLRQRERERERILPDEKISSWFITVVELPCGVWEEKCDFTSCVCCSSRNDLETVRCLNPGLNYIY